MCVCVTVTAREIIDDRKKGSTRFTIANELSYTRAIDWKLRAIFAIAVVESYYVRERGVGEKSEIDDKG